MSTSGGTLGWLTRGCPSRGLHGAATPPERCVAPLSHRAAVRCCVDLHPPGQDFLNRWTSKCVSICRSASLGAVGDAPTVLAPRTGIDGLDATWSEARDECRSWCG